MGIKYIFHEINRNKLLDMYESIHKFIHGKTAGVTNMCQGDIFGIIYFPGGDYN